MEKIILKLSIEEANIILEGLGEMPYKSVYHLINNIQKQAAQQAKKNGQETESIIPSEKVKEKA